MGYDLTKSRLVLTAQLIGISVELRAYKSVEFDPGSKRKTVPGARKRPLYVAIGASEPKVKIGFTDASEFKRAWQACGGQAIGATPCTLSCNLFDLASGSFEPWDFSGIILPEPGFKLGDDGYMTDVELVPTNAAVDGASIYVDG